MTEKDVIKETKPRMEAAIEDVRRKLATVRTGRASVSLLDTVMVDYYGTATPLNQMASVHAPEPQMLTVQPWDPTQLGSVEKAIRAADLGLNPSNDGKLVRVPIPPLTEERRKQLAKQVHRSEERRVGKERTSRSATGQAEDGIRDGHVTGVQTCALPIWCTRLSLKCSPCNRGIQHNSAASKKQSGLPISA